MLFYERLSAVVSITLMGMAVYFVLDFPAQTLELTLFGSPLEVETPTRWLMAFLLAGMAIAGTDYIVRGHPLLPTRRLSYISTFWALPGLIVLLATQTLGLSDSAPVWAISLTGVGVVLWLTVSAELRTLDPDAGILPRLWQQLVSYMVALLFFVVIYNTRSRSAFSATAVMLVSGAAALALLRRSPDDILHGWLLAGVVGLSLGQLTWALNYWRVATLNAGLLLFLAFYLLVGLSQQHLTGRVTRRTLLEFGAIALTALVVIAYL
jgi:hypothetical protein